jgi:hypothetical protein
MNEQLPAAIDRIKIIGDARAPLVPALIAGERASLRFPAAPSVRLAGDGPGRAGEPGRFSRWTVACGTATFC